MDWLHRLGEALHQARRRKGRTIDDVARATRVSPTIISLVERGHRRRVSFDVMAKLAKELGVSIDQILQQDPEDSDGNRRQWSPRGNTKHPTGTHQASKGGSEHSAQRSIP